MPVVPGDQPNTAAAIRFVEKNWGVPSFGFATSGHVANSCHYRGLALDAMTSDNRGDAIAGWFVSNPGAFGTTQVIWQRRIWTQSQGWHPYTGTNPHTNHVHVSLAPCGGSGTASGVIAGMTPVGLSIPNPLSGIGDVLGAFNTIASTLGNTHFWFRVFEVLAGAVLIFVGITTLIRPAIQPIVKAVV